MENFFDQALTITEQMAMLGSDRPFKFAYGNGEYTIGKNGCHCTSMTNDFEGAKGCKCAFPVSGWYED